MTGGTGTPRAETRARRWSAQIVIVIGAAAGSWAVTAAALKLFSLPNAEAALWWPPSALGVVAMVRLPRHRWAAFLIGFAAGMLTAHGEFAPLPIGISFTIVNVAEVLVASLLLLGRGRSTVRRLRTRAEALHFAWALSAALAVGAILVGLRAALLPGEQSWVITVVAYVAAHIIAILVFLPLLLPGPPSHASRYRATEWILVLAATVGVGWMSFLVPVAPSRAFALFLPVVWASARLGPARTSVVTATAVSLAAYGSYRDLGAFALIPDMQQRTWQAQGFFVSLAVTALLLVLITRHREYLAAKARAGEMTLRRAIRDSLVPMYSIRLDAAHFGEIQDANLALASMLGYSREQLEGQYCGILGTRKLPDRVAALDRHLRHLRDGKITTLTEESQFVRADGTMLWVETRINRIVPLIGPPFALVYVHDLTRRQANEKMLEELALSDPLTGLGNRTMLFGALAAEYAQQQVGGRHVGLLYIDLDGFKEVNDTFGHAAGDAVLVEVARRLSAAVRPGDTVARLGGDEFAVLCGSIRGPEDLHHIADRIRAHLRDPIAVGDEQFTIISASIGIAVDDGSADADRLLRAADALMYAEKRVARTQYRMPR